MEDKSEVYLAGGCFWGVQAFMGRLEGVVATEAGYANGTGANPTYDQVCSGDTGFVETVRVCYDPFAAPLPFLLRQFYEIIDPVSLNRQGNDFGTQYRTGIYYTQPADEQMIRHSLAELAKKYKTPLAIECEPLACFYPAEEYHQKYLECNPQGYCHISPEKFAMAAWARPYAMPDVAQLKKMLSPLQYDVICNGATEPPFQNEYCNVFAEGLYVDAASGEPLFTSLDKFDAGCGWPSFTRPVRSEAVCEHPDDSYGMRRTEVRSACANAHLGHVFDDGPKQAGGRRYCINSAALRFVPAQRLIEEGYGAFSSLFHSRGIKPAL